MEMEALESGTIDEALLHGGIYKGIILFLVNNYINYAIIIEVHIRGGLRFSLRILLFSGNSQEK